jgi:hypothetical protein
MDMGAVAFEVWHVSESEQIVISPETVREQARTVEGLERQAQEAREALNLLIGYLRATGKTDWIPASLANHATPAWGERKKKPGRAPAESGTWASEILLVIQNAADGMSAAEVKAAMADGRMAERLHASPNGFYNGVARLERNGDLVKYKGRLFARERMAEFLRRVADGEVADLTGRESGDTIIDQLVDFVAENDYGVTANQIVKGMTSTGMPAGSVYNNLSKAVSKGRVRREGKLYYPLEDNEAPSGDSK